METGVIKPSKVYYWISGLILFFGIIIFVVSLISGIYLSVGKLNQQVVVPGSDIIEFKEEGKYTLYFEYRSVIDGKVYETSNINGLICSLMNTETGEYIKLSNSRVDSSYSISGREGKSIFDFHISEAGKYEINAWYESGEGEEAVLVIGKGFGKSLAITIILSVGIMFISFVLSLAIFIITFIKRKKYKEDILIQQ